jgi:hypothetical protein
VMSFQIISMNMSNDSFYLFQTNFADFCKMNFCRVYNKEHTISNMDDLDSEQ